MSILRPIFLTNKVFYALGIIMGIFALGFSWHFLVYVSAGFGFLLIGAIILDLRMALGLSNHLKVKREVASLFSMFDENEVILTLTNSSGRDLELTIIDEIPIQFQLRDFELKEKLAANDTRRIKYELKPVTRGVFEFQDINVFFLSPLGLVEFRKTFEQPQTIKVYPSFVQMQKFEMMAFNSGQMQEGIRKIRRIGHGYEFSDIRHYVMGDDPRTVNWKASSRSGNLMVNNYEDEKSQQVYAVIDESRVMRMPFDGMSLMDYAINSSLAILNIALKNQDNAGLLTFSKNTKSFIPAKRRHDQLTKILDALYNQKSTGNEASYASLFTSLRQQVKNRSLILLFTNFLSINALQRALPELRRISRDHLLVVIFFENNELEDFRKEPIHNTMDMAAKTMADKLSEELTQVIYELRNAGIQAIKSRPEDLTSNTVSKYLELKSRGLI